jgi:RNA polymerase sigma factor (sigma-70 family)
MSNNSNSNNSNSNNSAAVDEVSPRRESPSGLLDLSGMYLEVRASLVRYTSRYFKRSQDAEEVVQEAFVKIIEAQRKRDIHSPKGYLFRTARNLSLKQLNKKSYKLTDELGDILTEPDLLISKSMEEQFEARENFEMFCRAVRALPVKCRRAFVLCRVYGYSQKEIAVHMGIGQKAVESHITRAIRRCADFMEAEQSGSCREKSSSKERQHG